MFAPTHCPNELITNALLTKTFPTTERFPVTVPPLVDSFVLASAYAALALVRGSTPRTVITSVTMLADNVDTLNDASLTFRMLFS